MPFNPVNMFNFNKPRNQPSPYPFPTTYVLALCSIITSLITFTILAYFSYYLRMDNMAIPAQFIFLLTTSLLTLLLTAATTTTHTLRTLSSPRRSLLLITGPLLTLWLIGLTFITLKLHPMVLSHSCTLPLWSTSMGVMVCRIYKALYSFIVLATIAAAAAVWLDVSVSREVASRGVYREMKDDGAVKRGRGGISAGEPSPALRRGFYSGSDNVEMKESPDLGDGGRRGVEFDAATVDTHYDNGMDDDTMRLVGKTPDLSELTPKLRPLLLQGRSMSNFWSRQVESPVAAATGTRFEAMRT